MKLFISIYFLTAFLTANTQEYHFVNVPEAFQKKFLLISHILHNTKCIYENLDFNNSANTSRKTFQDSAIRNQRFYDSLFFNRYYIENFTQKWKQLGLMGVDYAVWKGIHKNIHKVPKDAIYFFSEKTIDSLLGVSNTGSLTTTLPTPYKNVFVLAFKIKQKYYPYYVFAFRDDARLLSTFIILNFNSNKEGQVLSEFLSKYLK